MHAARLFLLLLLLASAAVLGERPALALPPVAVAEIPAPSSGESAQELAVTLGLRGERSSYRSELSGFLALAIPLERFAAPRTAVPSEPPPEPAPVDEDSAPQRETPATLAPLLASAELSRLCQDSVTAALRAVRLSDQRRELASMAARAQSSALLPELRLRAARARDESLRLTPTTEDPYRYTQDGGDDLVFEARATWKLTRLVFADEEIAIGRLELERDRAVERLSARVVGLVLAWHRAASAARSEDEKLRARAEFERLEAEVTLDVATAGWFGANAARVLRTKSAPAARRPRSAAPRPSAAPKHAPAPRESADLVQSGPSAKPALPCLPMHVTASKTF